MLNTEPVDSYTLLGDHDSSQPLRSKSLHEEEYPVLLDESGEVRSEGGHSSGCFAKGSLSAATYMLSSISLGVGVFGFPNTMNLCGPVGGALLLTLFAFVTGWCQYVLLITASNIGSGSYEETAQIVLGPCGTILQSIGIVLSCLTGNSAHIQAVGSLLADELIWFVTDKGSANGGEFHLDDSRKVIIYSSLLLFALPFCLNDNLGALRNISTLSVSTVMLITAWFFVYCIWLSSSDQSPTVEVIPLFGKADITAYFRASGSVCFAFTGCVNLFATVDQMKSPSQAPKAIAGSSALCFAVYFSVALLGALTFGTSTQGDCLYNVLTYHRDTLRPLIFMLVVFIVLLYPIINFPLVYNIQSLIWGKNNPPTWSRSVITVVTMLIVLCVDYFVTDIYDLFGLCGTLGLGISCLVLPCVIFLKADERSWSSPIKLTTLFCLVLGLLVSSVGTFYVIQNITEEAK